MSLRFGILGLLAEEPLHGYQVKQRFEEVLGGTWEVNIGSVYQTLQRLERDGLVEMTGDRGDRGRQAYRVTDAGVSALEEWLEDPESRPQLLREEVYVKLLLLGRQTNGSHSSGRLHRLLRRQRHVYLQRLRDLADQEKIARERGRPQLALLFKGGQLHTEADLKFLDAVVEEMESH
ncbi:PadR family transcriptional regulator [Candidatus Nephthysia bennettiae]|uniref:PadR family transcriptional regulator n=1 Tax=Candidatus Nephthysia bennettiae TaxID=3127016 RepID=A0A934K7B6_9BACT|nr:PadR family transcriptional regulator [Candidatus Dormibacteraeota bacterium]MBJ7614246.1 PadR family transcriptional regulator [Candidatus Dormibacteraeota bacterium]